MSIPKEYSMVTLGSSILQLADDGVQVTGATLVDVCRPWLSRQAKAAVRAGNDSLPVEMRVATGKRIRHAYIDTGVAVPENNDPLLTDIYKQDIYINISITGILMSGGQAAGIYESFLAAQDNWARRKLVRAKLADQELRAEDLSALDSEFSSLISDTSFSIVLSSAVASGECVFAEGDSFSASSYVISTITQYNFSLLLKA